MRAAWFERALRLPDRAYVRRLGLGDWLSRVSHIVSEGAEHLNGLLDNVLVHHAEQRFALRHRMPQPGAEMTRTRSDEEVQRARLAGTRRAVGQWFEPLAEPRAEE